MSLIRQTKTHYNLKCGKCGRRFLESITDFGSCLVFTTKRLIFLEAIARGWSVQIIYRKGFDRRHIGGYKILCPLCNGIFLKDVGLVGNDAAKQEVNNEL